MKPRPLFLLVLVVLVLLLDDFLLWRTIFEGFAILIPAGYGWYVVCECIGCTLHVPLVAILSCLANINVGVEIRWHQQNTHRSLVLNIQVHVQRKDEVAVMLRRVTVVTVTTSPLVFICHMPW
jgi:hypothetical protein